MNTNFVVEQIEKNKIIAIIRGVEKEKLLPLVFALIDGGIKLIEITFSADKKDVDVFNEIKMLSATYNNQATFGAGTVLTKKQVKLSKKAGAKFVVSPSINKGVIHLAKKLDMVCVAGAFSPTEVITANSFGADYIKIFPIDSVNKNIIKNLKSPFNKTKFLAYSGITQENIKDYLSSGAVGVGIGASLIDKALIEKGEYSKITVLSKQFIELVK